MTFAYLGNQRWADITREERLFCAELFQAIRGREGEFVAWLTNRPSMRHLALDPAEHWEVGYEVCFYRDLLFAAGTSARQCDFSPKRTFDLCLFSPTVVLVIEAKAQDAFDSKQNEDFQKDKRAVLAAIAEAGHDASDVRVVVVALAASRYFANVVKYGAERRVPEVFDGHFSWKELHESFADHELFLRAEATYKK